MDKQALLNQVRQAGFCLHEAVLFLDTHPDDKAAHAYFQEQRERLASLTEEYTSRFGPLHVTDVRPNMSGWAWGQGPWPWEKEAN